MGSPARLTCIRFRESMGTLMWNSRWIALIAVGLAGVASGQNPSGTAAIDSKLDTAQARVYIATLQPHVAVPSRQGHATNRVLIYLDNGVMSRQDGEQVTKLEVHRGEVRWRPASGAYVAENLSDRPLRILEIDLKGKPSGVATATKLDPVVVDAKHYKVEFENEQVRVLRVHYNEHDKGVEHEQYSRTAWCCT